MARYEESLSKIVHRFVEKIEGELGKGKYTIDISQIMKRLTMDTSSFALAEVLLIKLTFTALDVVWGNSHGFLDVGFDKNGSIKAKDVHILLPFLEQSHRLTRSRKSLA